MNEIYVDPLHPGGEPLTPEEAFLSAATKFAAEKQRRLKKKELEQVVEMLPEDVIPREDAIMRGRQISSGITSIVRPLSAVRPAASLRSMPASIALALMGKQSSENPFVRTDTNPDVLGNMLIERYKKAWLEWEPETLWTMIQKDFGGALGEQTKNTINAIKTLLLTDAFWKEYPVFENCIQALNGEIPDFSMTQPASPAQLAFGIEMAKRIRDNAFSDEIKSYVRAVMSDNGFTVYPSQLAFAQPVESEEVKQMKEAWEQMHRENPNFIMDPLEENAIGVLFARLNAVQLYVDARLAKEIT